MHWVKCFLMARRCRKIVVFGFCSHSEALEYSGDLYIRKDQKWHVTHGKERKLYIFRTMLRATSGVGMSAQGGKKDWCGMEGGDGRRAGRKGDIVNFPRILQGCETASTTLTSVEVQMCESHWLFMWYFLFHSMEHSARPMQSCPMRFIGFKRRWVYIELYKRMTCLYGCMIPFHVSS